ncbi:MAG: hypothetical protein JXR05_00385 [Flavobacteriaceae bacterium]
MKENKNIDRLFQEKMKGLEVTPGAHVWSAIESKLKKKKRRVLPFWWYSGGIAALFILGLFLFQFPKDQVEFQEKEQPIITTAPENTTIITKDSTLQFSEPVQREKIVLTKKTVRKPKSNKDIIFPKKEEQLLAINNVEKNTTNTQNEIPDSERQKKKLPKDFVVTDPIKDSIQKKSPVLKKNIITALQKNDSLNLKEKPKKKWSISPVFAVLNSNSLTKSSPITSLLNENPIEGGYTISYGIKIEHQLNSKWSIQSGVHLQKMNFITKNVAVVSGVTQSNIETIDFNSSDSYFFSNNNSSSLNLTDFGPNASSMGTNAELNQVFGYIEVPFEVKYLLTDNKKLSTGIIVGFSSLFLTTNEIVVKNTGSSQIFGQANNLNTVNFSGNFGLDLDYQINNHWNLVINPMVKTQLNTFSQNSNGFKPYSIGFYTGIKYQF